MDFLKAVNGLTTSERQLATITDQNHGSRGANNYLLKGLIHLRQVQWNLTTPLYCFVLSFTIFVKKAT